MNIKSIIVFIFFSLSNVALYCQNNAVNIIELERENVTIKIENSNEFSSLRVMEDDKIIDQFSLTTDVVNIGNLEASTIYNLVLFDTLGEEKFWYPIITKSSSSGEIRIYFNNDTDESYSDGGLANGEDSNAIIDAMIALIDNTQETLDMCSYNTNNEPVINALRRAHDRGVVIRFITDIDQNNFGLNNNIPFPVLRGSSGQGIMHNKFIISDAASEDLAWVQTGSTNYTNFQIADDPNHIILIQDKSLAQVYKMEFEEMWGSSGISANASEAKFGDEKADNTPHLIDINGLMVESYFSPSDKTADQIIDRINKANHEIDVAMLIFTRWELRDALADAARRGVSVKLLIEKEEESEEAIGIMRNAGAVIYLDREQTQMHHKYAIIDEGYTDSENITITGSKNWTYFGDTFNDENTLIINDQEIANIFRQEFQARWEGLATSTNKLENTTSFSVHIEDNIAYIDYHESIQSLYVSSIDGSYVSVNMDGRNSIDIGHLEAGLYIFSIRNGGRYFSIKVFIP